MLQNTSDALSGLAIGLIGFSTYLFILRGFYAHGDTERRFFLNVGENGLNVVLAVILVGPFGVFGLGLSLGIAYLVAAAVSLIILRQRHAHTLHAIAVTRDIAVLSVSAGIGGCSTWLLMSALSASSWRGIGGIFGAMRLSAVLFAVYITCTKVFKVDWKSLKAFAE